MHLRKSATIILLFVLVFNMIGYRAWFYYAEQRSDAAIEGRLDKNQYKETDLVSLTIPLNNPYQIDQKTFERVNGEINLLGKTFKYVKRKVADGNLVLLCIPDDHKMILKSAKTDFGKLVADIPNNSKGSSRTGLQKIFNGSDYTFQCTNEKMYKCKNQKPVYAGFKLANFSDPHITSPGKPPQFRA